jgi:hypothetical protein
VSSCWSFGLPEFCAPVLCTPSKDFGHKTNNSSVIPDVSG